MPRDSVKRDVWETIDYIGGGFVLQKRKVATISYEKSHRDGEVVRTRVEDIEDRWTVDCDNGSYRPIKGAHEKHRVIHISELAGVRMSELIGRIEQGKLNMEE